MSSGPHGPIFVGHMEIITGEWIEHNSAGGSRNNLDKFATNPQYIITLQEPGNFWFILHVHVLNNLTLPVRKLSS